MAVDGVTPVIIVAVGSAVVVASVYFYCHLRQRKKIKRDATRQHQARAAAGGANTVELDYSERNKENATLLVSLPMHDMHSDIYREPASPPHVAIDLDARPSRMVHPIDRAHRAAALAQQTSPALVAQTLPPPLPLHHSRSDDPLALGVPVHPSKSKRTTPMAMVVPVTTPAPAAAVASRQSPRMQPTELYDYRGKEETTPRTVQQVLSVQKPDAAALTPPSPTPDTASKIKALLDESVTMVLSDDEDENHIRTQPIEQLPRPIGTFRSPRMPAAQLIPDSSQRPASPSPKSQLEQQQQQQLQGRFSPTPHQQKLHGRFSPTPHPAMIVTSHPAQKSSHNANNNINIHNDTAQHHDQTSTRTRGGITDTNDGAGAMTPTTPSFSPFTPSPFDLPSPSISSSSPASSPPSSPSTGASPPTPPPRRKRSLSRPKGAATGAKNKQQQQQAPQLPPLFHLSKREEQRASSASESNSSESSSSTSTGPKRVLAPQDPSGLGTRLSAFNYSD